MTTLQKAFGLFDPQHDKSAAIKFAIIIMLMDRRLSDLCHLLTNGHNVAGVGGDPGWEIERRDENVAEVSQYSDWPADARFHVYVDPKGYHLAYPEMFLDAATFHSFVRTGLEAYAAADPAEEVLLQTAYSLLGCEH